MNRTLLTNVLIGVFSVSALTLGSACVKRIDPTSPETKNSPEGKACPPSEGLIADGENNSNQIVTIKGRGGYWYTFVTATVRRSAPPQVRRVARSRCPPVASTVPSTPRTCGARLAAPRPSTLAWL